LAADGRADDRFSARFGPDPPRVQRGLGNVAGAQADAKTARARADAYKKLSDEERAVAAANVEKRMHMIASEIEASYAKPLLATVDGVLCSGRPGLTASPPSPPRRVPLSGVSAPRGGRQGVANRCHVHVAKLQWSFKKSTEATFVVDVPDGPTQAFLIEKDSKRFPTTGG